MAWLGLVGLGLGLAGPGWAWLTWSDLACLGMAWAWLGLAGPAQEEP